MTSTHKTIHLLVLQGLFTNRVIKEWSMGYSTLTIWYLKHLAPISCYTWITTFKTRSTTKRSRKMTLNMWSPIPWCQSFSLRRHSTGFKEATSTNTLTNKLTHSSCRYHSQTTQSICNRHYWTQNQVRIRTIRWIRHWTTRTNFEHWICEQ